MEIRSPEGMVRTEADWFLHEHDGRDTQRTYAYLLVDHHRGSSVSAPPRVTFRGR